MLRRMLQTLTDNGRLSLKVYISFFQTVILKSQGLFFIIVLIFISRVIPKGNKAVQF